MQRGILDSVLELIQIMTRTHTDFWKRPFGVAEPKCQSLSHNLSLPPTWIQNSQGSFRVMNDFVALFVVVVVVVVASVVVPAD
jgi:hypothetical protein